MKIRRWFIFALAVLTLLCTLPDVAHATDPGSGDDAAIVTPAPEEPAPAPEEPAPAPEEPAPAPEDPAPAPEDPAPAPEDPAPAPEDPAPAPEEPAPAPEDKKMEVPVALADLEAVILEESDPVWYVSASDGTAVVQYNGQMTVTPTANTVKMKMVIDDGSPVSLPVKSFSWDAGNKRATYTFTPVKAKDHDQSVFVTAQYKDFTNHRSDRFAIAATNPIWYVAASNGTVTVQYNSALSSTPSADTAKVNVVINDGTPTLLVPNSFSWDASTSRATYTFEPIAPKSVKQSVFITAQFKNFTVHRSERFEVAAVTVEEPQSDPVWYVSASNGTAVVQYNNELKYTPTADTVKMNVVINDGTPVALAVKSFSWDAAQKRATYTFDEIKPRDYDQSVFVTAQYKDFTSHRSSRFNVAASDPIWYVAADNGTVTVQYNSLLSTTPTASTAKVNVVINDRTPVAIVPKSFSWDASTSRATYTFDPIAVADADQSVFITAQFKSLTVHRSERFDVSPEVMLMAVSVPTVKVQTSDGTPLEGVAIKGVYGGSTHSLGSTDENGCLVLDLAAGQYTLTATYEKTSMSKSVALSDTSGLIVFETSEARVKVQDSKGAPISGSEIKYQAGGSTLTFGTTNDSGIAVKELFAGSFNMSATYGKTGSGYTPVNVTAAGSGMADYTFETNEAKVKVQDSKGAPISGSEIKYQAGGSTLTFGTTNDSGIAMKELFAGSYNMSAAYAKTSSGYISVDVTADSGDDKLDYTFETDEAKVKVQDSNGAPISGSEIKYQAGGSTLTFGTTDGSGIAMKELFAGSYNMSASVNKTSSGYIPVDVTADEGSDKLDYTFVATVVTLNFPGTIRYSAGGSTITFVSPMALFPGTYRFTFSSSGKPTVTQELTIGGTAYSANLAVVSLKDSSGNGLAGGTVSYYAGSWVNNAATTDASGLALLQLPAGKNATSVTMNYKGGSIQINQSMASNPYYLYQTKKIAFKLLSSTGELLTGGAEYYAAGWRGFGDNAEAAANSTMEMLPAKYSFAATYAGARQQKDNVDISAVSEVVFTTVPVAFKLLDSKGAELEGGASYYAGGWKTFGEGTTTAVMEMLPVKYSFAVAYGGSRQQTDNVDVSVNPTVTFQTGSVLLHYAGGTLDYYNTSWHNYTGAVEMLPVNTLFELKKSGFPTQRFYITPAAGQAYEKTIVGVRLLSSTGAGLSGGEVKAYNGGWSVMGTTGGDGVYFGLLEGNQAKSLTFGMTYGGGYVQKSQNLASDSFVVFQTKGVVFKLLSSGGTELEGDAKYYAGGWKAFADGKTTGVMEMLPASYTFGVTYAGGYVQKSQDVGADQVVVFETVPVSFELKSSSGESLEGEAKYYAGGWKTFGEDGKTPETMELLPASYTFGVTYAGGYVQKSQNVASDPDVVFETVSVSFTLKSSKGDSLEGDAKYYAGGWKTFGTDGKTPETMELLPVSYTFGVTYMGGYMQKAQDVAADANVVFETVPVSFKLLSSAGLPLKGGASFYAGGWKTFGDGETSETVELLPVSYTFKVDYQGASIQKAQNVADNAKVVFSTKLVTVNLYAKTKVLGKTIKIPVLGPIGGDVSFYAGGWNNMGKTLAFKELLPTSYTFAVTFMGERQQIVQDVSSDSSVDFYTTAGKLKEAIKQALN